MDICYGIVERKGYIHTTVDYVTSCDQRSHRPHITWTRVIYLLQLAVSWTTIVVLTLHTHFNIVFILFSWDITLEYFKHIFFTSQRFIPHCFQLLRLGTASQVKQIIIFQFSECRTWWITPSTIRELVPRLCSINITLWTWTPKYWSDVFCLSFMIGWRFPWQCLFKVRFFAP